MSRNTLKILAVVLTVLIVVIGFNALDHLPGSVKAAIASERTAIASAQKQIASTQDAVQREVQSNSALFHSIPASQQWPGRFQQASAILGTANRDMAELSQLEQHGHRNDANRAESLLAGVRGLRTNALAQSGAIQTEADNWIARSKRLPAEAQQMEQNYKAIHAFDLTPVRATVQRAEADWPDKKTDLDSRLASVTAIVTSSDDVWQSAAKSRADVAKPPPDFDYGEFLSAGDDLKTSAASLPVKSAELQALAGQLYDNWDKILVDMEVRGIGSNRAWDQKIRTVRTHLADATAKSGSTTSEDKWVDVSQATYNTMRDDLGMAIEHKPAGKYDSESDHVAQPAGFAYMAPPAQGSNQYGYWEHRDGQSFWVFYGQYALMRDLLFNHQYRPLPRDDWEGYRTYSQRGQTYYGRDFESGGTKYGSSGTATQERYAGSTYGKSGGFRDSEYASKSGTYRSSPYATPSTRNGGDSSGHTFGRNEPHAAPAPSYHPAPRPSRPSGGGRTFGGRRR